MLKDQKGQRNVIRIPLYKTNFTVFLSNLGKQPLDERWWWIFSQAVKWRTYSGEKSSLIVFCW